MDDYYACIKALKDTGILMKLPHSQSLGIVGFDGQEYPVPTENDIQKLFSKNEQFVNEKKEQGFIKLLLTPLAMSVNDLAQKVQQAILQHAENKKIFSVDLEPVSVDTTHPLSVWDVLQQSFDTDKLMYFPKEYSSTHGGFTKAEVIKNKDICAVNGWSVGLVERMPMLLKKGKIITGRKQLETNSTPAQYLKTLQAAPYAGETGWTVEDFLTDFLVQLERTDQISHDWFLDSSLWLVGAFLPEEKDVPLGHWYRNGSAPGRLILNADSPTHYGKTTGGLSIVRVH